MRQHSTFTHRSLYHGWLPANPEVYRAFLNKHVHLVLRNPLPYIVGPSDWVTEFIQTIKDSSFMAPLMDMVFEQVNKDDNWAASDPDFRVRDIDHLQSALISAVSGPPEVIVSRNQQGEKIGEPIGVPVYLIFGLLSNTGAGYDLFRSNEFNVAMLALLNKWGNYLGTDPESNSTLTQEDSGWFGSYALSVLESGLQGQTFEETYGVNPAEAQLSYTTWDAFFTRQFTDINQLRPIIDSTRFPVIYNACESTSLRTAHEVKRNDTFWLKGQNYSLYDIFGGDPRITPGSLSAYADRFVGGSVYQAFLSPQDYHHWHSPIKGTIIEATALPGTYYAVLPDEGAPADDPDMQPGDPHGALLRSQPWLGVSAARGVIIIQPEDTSPLEWVAFVGVGMVEVSTIDIRVSQGDTINAGDQLGMFHFGGSTHIVIFQPKEGQQVVFKDADDITITPGQHRWVRSIIGRVEAVAA
ncbi:phosphatidylserine decarboxylase [Lanmaoa asiatica]|nr:phosphatidylserine decarboxylase [Lanmaoa asiatica]